MLQINPEIISHKKFALHRPGQNFLPTSRAYFAWQDGLVDGVALEQCEAGKFFPAQEGGLPDPIAPDDKPNASPPLDGEIASLGNLSGQILDKPSQNWRKHQVNGGEILEVTWFFTVNHLTRRWNYFITKQDWDPSRPLARDQFERNPIFVVQVNLQPFSKHSEAMMPPSPSVHQVPLPKREGYHVLLAVAEMADTPNALYQVVDLDFPRQSSIGEPPSTPSNLRATAVSSRSVALAWEASKGAYPIEIYRITRNGVTTIDIMASQLEWVDRNVEADTSYTYFISAIDVNGVVSAPSEAIEILTLSDVESPPPSAPKNLHSTKTATHSISLAWGASDPEKNLAYYIIYREGREIQRVSGTTLAYTDHGLDPGTGYRYFVAALDINDRLSVPSNVLTVNTDQERSSAYPGWKLNERYAVNDIVSHNGVDWVCQQAHISYTETWAPGTPGSESLWKVRSSQAT